MALTYYSDPQTEVLAHLKMIGVGAQQLASLTTAELTERQKRTDRWLDGRLRAVYRVPLLPVKRETPDRFPDPIPEIARRHCAGTLVMDFLSDVQPNQTDAAQKYLDWAEAELAKLMKPEYRLEGQRLKPRNPGSDPYTEPLAQPGTAESGGG